MPELGPIPCLNFSMLALLMAKQGLGSQLTGTFIAGWAVEEKAPKLQVVDVSTLRGPLLVFSDRDTHH